MFGKKRKKRKLQRFVSVAYGYENQIQRISEAIDRTKSETMKAVLEHQLRQVEGLMDKLDQALYEYAEEIGAVE